MTQHYAFNDTPCVDCGTTILKDDPIYFTDDGKLCKGCATANGLVCPRCSGQKKILRTVCYSCHTDDVNTLAEQTGVGRAAGGRAIRPKGE
jgi:hypothetical protein